MKRREELPTFAKASAEKRLSFFSDGGRNCLTRPSKTRRFSRSRRNGRPFEFRAREIPFCPPLVRTASISVRGKAFAKTALREVSSALKLPKSPPRFPCLSLLPPSAQALWSAKERKRALRGRFCKAVFTYGQE